MKRFHIRWYDGSTKTVRTVTMEFTSYVEAYQWARSQPDSDCHEVEEV